MNTRQYTMDWMMTDRERERDSKILRFKFNVRKIPINAILFNGHFVVQSIGMCTFFWHTNILWSHSSTTVPLLFSIIHVKCGRPDTIHKPSLITASVQKQYTITKGVKLWSVFFYSVLNAKSFYNELKIIKKKKRNRLWCIFNDFYNWIWNVDYFSKFYGHRCNWKCVARMNWVQNVRNL